MSDEFRKFTVILEMEEDGGYSVHCPALPGCSSQGDDRDDALAMIAEAIELVLEVVEKKRDSDPAVEGLPLADTRDLLVKEVKGILEFRVEYGLPKAIEFAEVIVPAPVPT